MYNKACIFHNALMVINFALGLAASMLQLHDLIWKSAQLKHATVYHNTGILQNARPSCD